ncbi:MAG: hypothetical protein AAGA92_12270 [Planctomycetota bacterium]
MESAQPLTNAIQPLLNEQFEIESCVRDSFSAVEQLHRDLAAWQAELERREAEIGSTPQAAAGDPEEVKQLNEQLTLARDEMRQLEEESAEQLTALEAVERQHAILQAELRVERKRAQELVILLDSERARSAEEHRTWTGELRTMRQMLERQNSVIEELAPESPATLNVIDVEADPHAEQPDASGGERSAELRRRANSRRAASKARQQRDYG